MIASAPFDNWWHEAYGLDVKIISPPHMLLALGIAGIMWGGAILGASYLNRAQGEQRLGHSHDIVLEFERVDVANAGVQADLVVNKQECCVLTREKW